jgi:RIO-like serine/threonine protein kinase fused to N-terminal HTH domain
VLTLPERLEAVNINDVRLLELILKLHRRYSFIPLSVLEGATKGVTNLSSTLAKLLDLGLVRSRVGPEYMYQITFRGLDILAIAELTRRGVLARVGDVIGVGKESEVYLAWTPAGTPVALKLHREGARSFRNLKRSRKYRGLEGRQLWIDIAIEAASREFIALVSVSRAGGLVPRPIDRALHAVVTAYLDGVELEKVRGLSMEEASKVLYDVVLTVRSALKVARIVHGDLSPYNVLVVRQKGSVSGYVIDWPQYISAEDLAAKEALVKDLKRLATYFNKSFGLNISAEDLLREVQGGEG